mgnify:CR=1 FL=1
MKKESREQIFIKAIAMAVKQCKPEKSISKIAMEYGISTSTTSDLINAKKDFYVTSIAKIAEAIDVKLSYFFSIVETNLPENFSLFED